MKRIFYCALAITLLVLAALIYVYWDELYKQTLVVTLVIRDLALRWSVLTREFLWRGMLWVASVSARVMGRRALVAAVIYQLSRAQRRRLFAIVSSLRVYGSETCQRLRAKWDALPKRVRLGSYVSFGVAVCAVSVFWEYAVLLLTFLPKEFYAWGKRRLFTLCMRVATAKGLDRLVPAMLRTLPRQVRERWMPRHEQAVAVSVRYQVYLRHCRQERARTRPERQLAKARAIADNPHFQ